VDDGLTFTLKTTSEQKVEATPELKFDDNLTVKATFKNPSKTGSGIDIGANYVTKDFSAELEGCLTKKDWDFKSPGFALGIATDLPVGVDGLKLGLQPAFLVGGGMNAAVNLAYEQSDYQVGINTFLTDKAKDSNYLGGTECVIWYKASDDLQIAGKYATSSQTKGKKLWETPEEKAKSSYSLVTNYSLSKTQTAKAKVTIDAIKSETTYDFSLKTALEGKSSATFNVMMKGEKAPKFGFLYNLE